MSGTLYAPMEVKKDLFQSHSVICSFPITVSECGHFVILSMSNNFYVTEGPFMYLTVCCRFLICCVGEGGNRVVKLAVLTTLFSVS